MEDFQHLSAQRLIGEAPQPIQVSEVLAHCTLVGIADPEDRERLMKTVRALDAVFLGKVAQSRASSK